MSELEKAARMALEATTQPVQREGSQGPFDGEPMSAHKAAYFIRRFKQEEKMLGPNEQLALDFVLSMLTAAPAPDVPETNFGNTTEPDAAQEVDWRTPTTYARRFADAITLLCREVPPADMVAGWIDRSADDQRLQDWACERAPAWAQGIGLLDAAHVMASQPTEGVDHEPTPQPATTERKGEPVYWEWRHMSTHPDTVDFGQWSEWKRVEPRSVLQTLDQALNEFRAYIAKGYKYELRALYTSPQVPEDVMSVLSAIHRRPSDAGIWLDDLTRIIRAARKGE